MEKLRIGRMAYANLFPLFYMLEKGDCSQYEFVQGVPTDLNAKIRNGAIDVAPSSSVEYLRNREKYDIIDHHSISSKGPVKSIFLFTRGPIERLQDAVVLTSSQSETSVVLLRIVLEKFYGLNCRYQSASEDLASGLTEAPAYLLIGDQAMQEAARWRDFTRYDLGEIWYRHTALPMVFALWISRREIVGADLLSRFRRDLDRAKERALGSLEEVAEAYQMKGLFAPGELVEYWRGISYDFGDEHKKGFALFGQYAEEVDAL